MTRLAPLLVVGLVAVLVGCATTPTETTPTPALTGNETFEVRMAGDPSATYVVSADLVAEPFENVTVTYANGSDRVVAVPEGKGGYSYGPDSNVTDVEPRDRVVGGVYFQGSPNFTVTANDVPPTGNVVYAVRKKGEDVLVAWGLVRCGGHVTGLSLTVNGSGVTGIGFGCEA